MKIQLTPEQIQYSLRMSNVHMVSKESGIGYSTCHKLSLYGKGCSYSKSTIEKMSEFLLKEHEKFSEIYGLNKI